MKKRILASLLALCMFIAVAPISALAADPVTTEEELLAAVENGGEITLGASLTQSIVIPAGKTVILNLNGKTLTNNGSTDTITVEQGRFPYRDGQRYRKEHCGRPRRCL